MRLFACLIVAPQRGYDEPAILSYAISSFCPTSADGLHFDTSTPASTAALATWRPSFAAGLVGARVPGTSPLRIWSTRLTTFSATAGVSLDQG